MQYLDVISINLWQMLVSLANLLILLLLIKKFLYKPVKNMLNTRQATIDGKYSEAEAAKAQALSDKKTYEDKLTGAQSEADGIIQDAVAAAREREKKIVEDAKYRADGIIRQAEADAELEMKKSEAQVKEQIIEVSALLTKKMLEREISADDHKKMIDSFIEGIGDE